MDSDFLKKFISFNKEREKYGIPPVSRRTFLKLSAMAALSLTFPFAAPGSVRTVLAKKKSSESEEGRIIHDEDECVGCGVCGLMCSLYKYGEQSPTLSRSELIRDPFTYDHIWYVCQQCKTADCYHACPEKDKARFIDPKTKAKYVIADKCIGCGKCIKACIQKPARVKLHPITNKAMNCDLCRGRADGPICVEYCTMNAISYTPVGG